MANQQTLKAPAKKLQEFCKQHNISWSDLDHVLAQCDHHELDTLNTGNFQQAQVILNKYL